MQQRQRANTATNQKLSTAGAMVNKMPIYRPPIQASKARMVNQSKAYYLATIIASGFITMHKSRGESSYFFWSNSSEAGEASAKRSDNGARKMKLQPLTRYFGSANIQRAKEAFFFIIRCPFSVELFRLGAELRPVSNAGAPPLHLSSEQSQARRRSANAECGRRCAAGLPQV